MVSKCSVCGREFPPQRFIPGHSEQWKLCPGSYKPPKKDAEDGGGE